jgi:hypothetical protein
MRTDPGKHFERLLSIGLLQLSLVSVCHVRLNVEDCTFRRGFQNGAGSCVVHATPEARDSVSRLAAGLLLYELCAGPTENPDGWFDPPGALGLCTPGFDCFGDLVALS